MLLDSREGEPFGRLSPYFTSSEHFVNGIRPRIMRFIPGPLGKIKISKGFRAVLCTCRRHKPSVLVGYRRQYIIQHVAIMPQFTISYYITLQYIIICHIMIYSPPHCHMFCHNEDLGVCGVFVVGGACPTSKALMREILHCPDYPNHS